MRSEVKVKVKAKTKGKVAVLWKFTQFTLADTKRQ
jgi:hypothetical protein